MKYNVEPVAVIMSEGRTRRVLRIAAALLAVVAVSPAFPSAQQPGAEWIIDNLTSIGGHPVTVLGAPRVVETEVGRALEFNGVSDGIFVDANPLEGLGTFTLEVLFSPAADGPPEQRFVHIEDTTEGGNRALIETRILPGGVWSLDTFLKQGEASRALLDREQAHPANGWYVASLVYDGRVMTHFVNATKELSGDVTFGALGPGRTSLGVRQNKVYWFKGRIRAVRVTPRALPAAELMRVPPAAVPVR